MEENPEIGIRLRMLNNAVRRYFERNSEFAKKLDKLTCSNKWIMGYLFDAENEGKDVFQRDLENNFGITRSTVSKVLSLLEKKELIRRESVSHDARLKKIVLTEKSREIGRTMRREHDEMENKLRSGFSDAEISDLCGFLERMMNNIASSETGAAEKEKKSRPKGDN